MAKEKKAASISIAAKLGFGFIILAVVGAGVFIGLKLLGEPTRMAAGARLEDLPKELQQRIKGFAAASKARPNDLSIRSQFCHALMEGRILSDADACYREILKIDPTSPDVYTHLGEISFYREDFDASRNFYERALGMDSDYSHAYFNLGYLKMSELKDYEGARLDYANFLRLNPESPIKNQVTYLILQLNDLIGDRPGLPKNAKETVINPKDLLKVLKQ